MDQICDRLEQVRFADSVLTHDAGETIGKLEVEPAIAAKVSEPEMTKSHNEGSRTVDRDPSVSPADPEAHRSAREREPA